MRTYDKIKKTSKKLGIKDLVALWKTDVSAFTRESKLSFMDMTYFILNKRGQTLEMEIDNFKDVMGENWQKVTESAICQKRQYINPEIFKDLNRDYVTYTYDDPADYKTYKDYLIFAIDGMDIELPNVAKLREEFGEAKGKKGQRAPVRATTSSIYDVVNNMVIDSQIAKYNTSERELAKYNIMELLSLLGNHEKILIIFDRGYPSIEFIYFLQKFGIKYLFRLNSTTYKEEVNQMKTDDEEIKLQITSKRLSHIESKEEREEIKKQKEISIRLVKTILESGEQEILVTNLGREEFGSKEIVELYFYRWNIELAYDIAKNKLEIENFSGYSKTVIEQDFYAQIFLLNIAEDLRKDANTSTNKTKENGYKYDYKPNMNILIGKLRKRFILILLSIALNKDEESQERYDELIEEINRSLVPIRSDRSNPRNKYKGCNKYKHNLRRNS